MTIALSLCRARRTDADEAMNEDAHTGLDFGLRASAERIDKGQRSSTDAVSETERRHQGARTRRRPEVRAPAQARRVRRRRPAGMGSGTPHSPGGVAHPRLGPPIPARPPERRAPRPSGSGSSGGAGATGSGSTCRGSGAPPAPGSRRDLAVALAEREAAAANDRTARLKSQRTHNNERDTTARRPQ
jgi:hypothetical protein